MSVRAGIVVVLAVFHTAAGLVHGAVHAVVNVIPGPADLAFILAAIFVGPPVGAYVFVRGSSGVGSWVFGASMGASFAYGFLSHFVLPGPDHVASVGFTGWGALFFATTAVLGVLQAAGVLALLLSFPGAPRTPSAPVGPSV